MTRPRHEALDEIERLQYEWDALTQARRDTLEMARALVSAVDGHGLVAMDDANQAAIDKARKLVEVRDGK